MADAAFVTHRGGCHCRRVRFEVEAPAALLVQECNCSLCRMSGFHHLIVPAARFRLLSGDADLSEYTFNTGVAKHRFCRVCGVKSFYIPRSNPDGVDVNARCLDDGTVESLTIEPFDGQNWESNAASLAQLTLKEGPWARSVRPRAASYKSERAINPAACGSVGSRWSAAARR